MKLNSMRWPLLILLVTLAAGCGGSNTMSAGVVQPPPTQSTTAATLKISSDAPQLMSGIQVTLTLPAGVSVETDTGGIVKSGVVTASGTTSGSSSFFPGSITYDPTQRKLQFILVSSLPPVGGTPTGFGAGEFATVTCRVSGTTLPAATAFSAVLEPYDLNGGAITGVNATFQIS